MRTLTVGATIFFVAGLSLVNQGSALAQPKAGGPPPGPGLTLTSPDFEDGGVIPNKYTQADPNPISPKLEWTHVPPGTVSFALILHDPDVAIQKKNDDVLHWMIFNIPGRTRELPEGIAGLARLPDGSVQALNQAKKIGYMGMAANVAGPYHHYTFELFALDTKLKLGPDATQADLLKGMNGYAKN